MTNIIRAIFEPNKYTAIAARPDSKPIYQYNYGQILQIHGLDLQKAVEIHFAHSMGGSDAIIRIGTTTDKITEVAVPEMFLKAYGTVTAYIYVSDTESGQTEYKIQFQIAQRAKPEAWDSPEDAELFHETIEAVNESAEKAEDAAVRAEEAAGKIENATTSLEYTVEKAETLKDNLDEITEQITESATRAESAKTASEAAKDVATQSATVAETSAHSAEASAVAAETAKDIAVAASESAKLSEERTTDGNSELIDIRTGTDGMVYDTAGNSVRKQFLNVNEILQEISEIESTQNLLNLETCIVGAQLSTTGILLENGTAYTTTDYIEINPINAYYAWRYNPITSSVQNGHISRICYYTVEKSFISLESLNTDNTDTPKPFTIPGNAMYMRCHIPNSYITNQMIWVGENKPEKYIPYKSDRYIKNSAIPSNVLRSDTALKTHYLYGKKVAWYGDSIIKATGWTQKVNDYFNFDATNCGVGGTKISSNSANSMNQQSRMLGQYSETIDENTGEVTLGGLAIPPDTEVIIVGGGTNDWAQNIDLGDRDIKYTQESQTLDVWKFRQACHNMFNNLKILFPGTEIIVIGTPFGKMANRTGFLNKYGVVNNQNLQSTDYGDALLDVAGMWGLKGFNYGRKLGINDANVSDLLEPDATDSHLHPYTEPAISTFADVVVNELMKLY